MLLRTEKLTKQYGQRRALDSLNLTLSPGEIFGLLGPNGAGKSTAIRMILGFLRPTSGQAWIQEHDCWKDSVAARRCVSYLPGELRLYENMTGGQLLQFLSDLRGTKNRDHLDSLIRALDIDLSRPIRHLSSGMKRKVALLVMFAPDVPLLILDEPTNTLDPNMRDELLSQLERARERGQAVLFSSHVLSEVEQICDRVGILRDGVLVHHQTMKELTQAHRIRVDFQSQQYQFAPLPDLKLLSEEGRQVVVEYPGPLQDIMQWLSSQPVDDMTIEPVGLSSIYRHYHGTQA
ncbi:MAG: ABC transporter ATP-binding protein [Gemmataceae bacterium]